MALPYNKNVPAGKRSFLRFRLSQFLPQRFFKPQRTQGTQRTIFLTRINTDLHCLVSRRGVIDKACTPNKICAGHALVSFAGRCNRPSLLPFDFAQGRPANRLTIKGFMKLSGNESLQGVSKFW